MNSQFSQRKTFSSEKKNDFLAIVVTLFLSSIIGTCLDAFFINKQIYSFPARPFSSIFSVNIAFTLLVLPILTASFIQISKKLSPISRTLFIISIGVCASIFEQVAERLGLFVHSTDWQHSYSLFGYIIFFSLIWKLYNWMLKIKRPFL
ncbi:CBO0543 family protein [Bacillus nitratireducens]|uniref:CBO0543 family protein n=1 Tax=Bacillus nitratireducens TaxID=2026193 RepID=UPI001BEDBE59|nr:CBO0543 family protein [Bacillus nitratireducens]MED0992972.1 hypothetical protein [Bacillus nitratireducens]QUG86905.1 hypothetical protein GSN03_17680 [Bacillus nitratireducens]